MNFTVPAASDHQMGDCRLSSVSDNAATITPMSNQRQGTEAIYLEAPYFATWEDFLDDIGIGSSSYIGW